MRSVADLMADAEQADDAYQAAVVACALARADYELAYYKTLAQSVVKSAAGRKEEAEAAANEQHRLFIVAEAREKAARTHVQVVLGLMVAAQSVAKHGRAQDGGDGW